MPQESQDLVLSGGNEEVAPTDDAFYGYVILGIGFEE